MALPFAGSACLAVFGPAGPGNRPGADGLPRIISCPCWCCVPLAAWRFERLPMRPRAGARGRGGRGVPDGGQLGDQLPLFQPPPISPMSSACPVRLSGGRLLHGIRTFLAGQYLTELSDGQVEMYVFAGPAGYRRRPDQPDGPPAAAAQVAHAGAAGGTVFSSLFPNTMRRRTSRSLLRWTLAM